MNHENILLHTFHTPFETIPFGSFELKDLEEAITLGLKEAKSEIELITKNVDEPTFENTIVALENSGDLLSRSTSILFNLAHANTNDDLDALVNKISPSLSEHSNEVLMNMALFERIKKVYDKDKGLLEGEDQRLLQITYDQFYRNGALLNDEQKEELKTINMKLSQLSIAFSQNVLNDINDFELLITDENQLEGLPEVQKEKAAEAAKEKKKEGWLFSLHAPSYGPFMKFVKVRSLREQMYRAYNTLCTHNNKNNNFEQVREIVNLRLKKAQLLGYDSYADYALEPRMAKNARNVEELLNNLITHYLGRAKEEVAEIEEVAKRDGIDQLMPWDFSYYSHLTYISKFNLDTEKLRPYFEVENVKQGIFGLAQQLYGIHFTPNSSIPVYQKDVEAYEVREKDGALIGIFYLDLFPRNNKQPGAWMTEYQEGTCQQIPLVSIVLNAMPSTATTPSLLSLGEVNTFLHEFGHALHGLFGRTTYKSQSGTNVERDFVELPSQFMENYANEESFLKKLGKHYQTGASIPQDYLDIIKKSSTFNSAYACIRQVSFGLIDMSYHTLTRPFDACSIAQHETEVTKRIALMPVIENTCMTPQFGHIMSGGYAAGYYSYKWSEVLDADAFDYFKQMGIYNADVAHKFRTEILEKGDTQEAMALYINFRGQEPSIKALMKRDGILPNV